MTSISIVLVVVSVGSRDHGRGSGSVPFSTLDSQLSRTGRIVETRGATTPLRSDPSIKQPWPWTRSRRQGPGHQTMPNRRATSLASFLPPTEFLGPRPHAGLYRIPLYLEDSTQRTCLPPKKVQAKVQGPPVRQRHGPSNVDRNLNHALLAWLHAVAWHERGGPACSCSHRAVLVTGLPACRLPCLEGPPPSDPLGSRAMSDIHGTFS